MKKYFFLSIMFFALNSYAQDDTTYEKWPVFPECESLEIEQHKTCFNQQLSQFIFENFEVPDIVAEDNTKATW